ncbi:MAG: tryptophan synthase subunit alpha, partial [Planctomycetaceae bacterium]|nr:tryptophan synthase subunit alpha [Planctomycetaceae bacterium]
MTRLTQIFEKTRNEKRAALIGYITAGDPDIERSFEIIDAACGAGLDVLELGIPFS